MQLLNEFFRVRQNERSFVAYETVSQKVGHNLCHHHRLPEACSEDYLTSPGIRESSSQKLGRLLLIAMQIPPRWRILGRGGHLIEQRLRSGDLDLEALPRVPRHLFVEG